MPARVKLEGLEFGAPCPEQHNQAVMQATGLDTLHCHNHMRAAASRALMGLLKYPK